jgi:hypothetical protein
VTSGIGKTVLENPTEPLQAVSPKSLLRSHGGIQANPQDFLECVHLGEHYCIATPNLYESLG